MLTNITQNEINNAYNKYSRKYEGRKEDYYSLLYLSKKHNLNPEDVASNVAFGGNDYGLDAFYFDEKKRNLYLYQFKWSKNHMLFKESFKKLIKDGLERVFGNPYQDKQQNQMLINLKTCLLENHNIIDQVFIHFVFNGNPDEADRSSVLSSLREDLESKTYLINDYFKREVGLIFQYISNNQMGASEFVRSKKSHKYEINCESFLSLSNQESEIMITFIPLSKLLEMYSDLGEKLFDKNIRSGLGKKGKATHKEIKRSLKKVVSGEESPENFAFYHNGISLTAEKLERTSDILTMIEPRVLNGAQTVMALKSFVDDNKGDSRVPKSISIIKVMVRIIRSKEDEFLKKVTINNNRQNPIMPWNLRAHDIIQLEFEDKFRKELGIYYERRENAFANLTDEDLEQIGIIDYKAIEIKKFAQTLLAIQGEIKKMSKIAEVFENENYYKNTFKEKYLKVDAKKLVLFYKIQYRLPSVIREILSKGEYKYHYVTKARNLLWALLIQSFLNDDEHEEYIEKYGVSLTIESDFTLKLKDLASRKIRFVLSKTFKRGKYAEYLKDEKYSFLKSKATYDDCMEKARKLYEWYKINV